MHSELFNWTAIVYVVGFIISLVSSVQCFLKYSDLKQNMGIDLLKIRPGMKFYLILKPIFWPLYFFIEKVLLNGYRRYFLNITVMQVIAILAIRGLRIS